MISVDLNCDLGESFGAYTIGMDEAVIPLITSANVACGYHAGDPLVMAKTVARCREAGVHVGAHPGFPDLMGFGRRSMNVSPAEAKAYIQYQLGAGRLLPRRRCAASPRQAARRALQHGGEG